MIFWTKPPKGDGFRICYALDITIGRKLRKLQKNALGHLHFSCVFIDGELTQEEGRAYFWRPPEDARA